MANCTLEHGVKEKSKTVAYTQRSEKVPLEVLAEVRDFMLELLSDFNFDHEYYDV